MFDIQYKKIFIAMLSISIITGISYSSEAGSAFYEFLEDPVNSRSIGMGSAGTALPDNRGFFFYNPALPAINSRPYISFDYNRQYEDLGRAQAEFSWVSKSWFIDIGFLSQSTGEFKVATEQGVLDGATQTDAATVGTIGGGFRNETYGIGITISGIQNKIADSSSYGVVGNAGAIVNLFENKLYAGAGVFNLGKHSSFLNSDRFNKNELPLTVRGGFSWNDTINSKFPYSVAADVVYSKNYDKVMVPLGVEFRLFPALSIRAGKRINFKSDLFSLGFGIHLQNLGFDAAFTPAKMESDFNMKWSSGLTYTLASLRKKATGTSVKNKQDTLENVPKTEASKDTVRVFKEAVEKKIIRKKPEVMQDSLITDTVIIDKQNITDTVQKTNLPADSVNEIIKSSDTTLKVIPDTSKVQDLKPKTEDADSSITVPVKAVIDSMPQNSVPPENKQNSTLKPSGVKTDSDSDILE